MASIGDTTRPEYIYDQATDTWIPVGIGPHSHTPAAIGAIASSIVTTKGDIIAATGSGLVVRQGVGTDGSMLVADSSQADGLSYALGNAYAAGKNKVINGDFFINQRGFTLTTTSNTAVVDRFRILLTAAAGSVTTTLEQFTPGTAPVAGYEAKQYVRVVTTGQAASTDRALFAYYGIEDVRTFAGQTVTLSFWAKAASGTPSVAIDFAQFFGTGGSPSTSIVGINPAKTAITTSWARYSFTSTIPSISGKTIGTDPNTSALQFGIWLSAGSSFDSRTATLGVQNNTFDIWGVQVEAGSVATPFQTASGSIGGELALCQRYYYRIAPGASYRVITSGQAVSANDGFVPIPFPVQMRIRPTALEQSGTAGHYSLLMAAGTRSACSSVPVYDGSTTQWVGIVTATSAGALVTGNCTTLGVENASAYLGWSAEL